MEILVYVRAKPIIDPLLPREQAWFRPGMSTVDQVTLLTQEIEDSFLAKKRSVLCLLISQQPTILYGIVASLQASAFFAGQAHALDGHRASPQQQFHPNHRLWIAKQVATL